jgi:ferritin-like metal-binding protein YciE
MRGLIEEAGEAMKEDGGEHLTDSAIICAAQKVEHYEIAGYGSVAAWAKAIGLDEVADLLDETLEEEKAADEKLTDVASGILAEAADAENSSGEEEEDEAETADVAPKKSTSNKGGARSGSRRTG